MWKYKIWRFILAVYLLLNSVAIFANLNESEQEGVSLPRSAKLPNAFSRFSANDVLSLVFEGYDSATGRVASIHDADDKPALVRIDEAKLWRIQNKEYLIVLIGIAADDYQFDKEGGLCGNCATYSPLAVLERHGGNLSLVAKQLTRSYSDPRRAPDGDISSDFEATWYTGHDHVWLDLAPYKLNSDENLIGVRLEHIWIPAASYLTTLTLYRIEGQRLKPVFTELVVDRSYPKGVAGNIVTKTVSTLISVPKTSTFYDLVINKNSFRCIDRNEDWDCNPKHERVTRTEQQNDLWRFNGDRFVKAER